MLDIYEDMHKIKELRASNRPLREISTSPVKGNTIWTEGKFSSQPSRKPKEDSFLLYIFAVIGHVCTVKDDLIFCKLVSNKNYYDNLGKSSDYGGNTE